jgi:hypothetical protein
MASNKDYEDYVDLYGDLVRAAAESGMSKAEFGKAHYERHGSGEGRVSPDDAGESDRPEDRPSPVHAAESGEGKFPGTNIPLSAVPAGERQQFIDRLNADIGDGNTRGANDVIFDIAYSLNTPEQQNAGGQGNPNIGAVQSGVWKLDSGPRWAEQNVNSVNDEYRMRDESGNLTGEVVRFSDTQGVMKGTPTVSSLSRGGTELGGGVMGLGGLLSESDLTAGLSPTGSWGGNARAGIVAGQPTYGTSGPIDWQSYGNDPGWEMYFETDPALGPARVQNPRAGAPQYAGTPTYNPSQIGAGGSGEYGATPYSRPALQDWSALAPPTMPGLLGTAQAQQALLANNLAAYQPQAQGGVLDYAPRGGSTWAPRTYSANPLDNSAAAAAAAASSSSSSGDGYTGPLGKQWDSYQDWYMADRPSWGDPAGYTTSPLGGHQAALNRLYEARTADQEGLSYDQWFHGQGGKGASAGPIFGGVLGNGQ